MIAITNQFKQNLIKFGREIEFQIITYKHGNLITEDGKLLVTQNNINLVVEQINSTEIDEILNGEDIYNVSVITKGNLLSTMMKEVDFEIKKELNIGEIVDCSFGLKVGNNYEYINYGKFIIYSREKNEDTNTYNYVAFDSMLASMVKVDDISIVQNVTVKKAIENICDKVGLNIDITAQDVENLPNLTKIINENAFKDIEITYRDILDMICQCLGVSMTSNNRILQIKTINRTEVDLFDEQYLKDKNVKFGDKYLINTIALSRDDDKDIIYKKDEQSIETNGIHELKIKDNLIMNYDDREDYIDEIYNQLNGLEFYINDFSSTGITYLDWLDMYNITINSKTYKCLLLNDEIKIQQGLEESIYTEIVEETTPDYTTSSKSNKEISFVTSKQNGELNNKVSKGDVINQINLDDSGKIINAEKISLDGKKIDLTNNFITIVSTNFQVDEDGYMECTDADISGKITSNDGTIGTWDIDSNGLSNANGSYIYNKTINTESYGVSNVYTISDILMCELIINGVITVTSGTPEFEHYDVNKDGQIDTDDLLIIKSMMT